MLERAAAYQKHGDFDLAITDLSELIGRESRRANHYATRGKAYQAKGDDERALKDLDQVIAMDPGDPFYKIARAASRRRKRAYDRAIARAAAAITDPALLRGARSIIQRRPLRLRLGVPNPLVLPQTH